MKLFFSFLISGLFVSLPSQKTTELDWGALIPEGFAFHDPFAKLTEDQLYDLAQVARIELLIENKPTTVSQEMKTKKEGLKGYLQKQGINADELIAQREYVTEMRTKNANAVVKELHMSKVKLAGYLLPLNIDNEKSSEFLLVPWVGACIHTPPPPKNQIVHVFHPQGYKAPSRYQAVVVEGMMFTGKSEAELYLIDGSSMIQSLYTMKETTITPYKK